jgi:hypothetical protein
MEHASMRVPCVIADDEDSVSLTTSAPGGRIGLRRDEARQPEPPMTHSELAWEFADLFGELPADQINEVLAKNVPLETLEFFNSYAASFGKSERIEGQSAKRLPNLLLLGYLLRVLEERLFDEDGDVGFS